MAQLTFPSPQPIHEPAAAAVETHANPHRSPVRSLQIALGLLWLLDGVLQLQPFMFGHRFITEVLLPSAAGQPAPVAHSIAWSAHLVAHHLVVWNGLFAAAQITVGVGLLRRRTVRTALVASFVWAGLVWWLGEGFGMLLTGGASPLTGAPGSVLLYALLGVLVWPAASPGAVARRRNTARTVWAALWFGGAALWLLPANRSANAVHDGIATAASGEPKWLSRMLDTVANPTGGHGAAIAIALAIASVVVGVGALGHRPAPFVVAGGALAAGFWVVGQAFGAVLTGQATDPNTGPLVVLLAVALLTQHSPPVRADPDLAEGCAWVPFNQPGDGAADLTDGAAEFTSVVIESAPRPAR
jgi:hypothetical protein